MSLLDASRSDAAVTSLVARLDPRTRVGLALAFAMAAVFQTALPTLGIALAAALALAGMARLSFRLVARRLLALEGFMLVVLALLPVTVPGTALAAPLGVALSAEGFHQAAVIALRANGVAVAVLALAGSMDMVTLGRALGGLGVPARLVHLFLFTVRYLEVLEREYARLRLAMRARAFHPRAGLHCWGAYGHLFGMLLVRSLERAERIEAAMRCRGFAGGDWPSLEGEGSPRRPGALDWGFGAAASVLLAVMVGL